MKKLLIIGSTGMLGHELLNVFSSYSNFKIYATYRNKAPKIKKNKNILFIKLEVFNSKQLEKISKINFDYIINCIGKIKPLIDENLNQSVFDTIYINSVFPYLISKKFPKTKIFQIATDCVFSGKKGSYCENDKHDAEDVYGKSKSLGEIKRKFFFNIRCSIIGKEIRGKMSLLEWFLSSKKNSFLNGFANHYWNGLTTRAFSFFLLSIIKNNIKLPSVIHAVPKNQISKYNMLKLFSLVFERQDLKIRKINSNLKTDRTLNTIHKKLVNRIWLNSIYKKTPQIQKIIYELKY